MFKCIFSLFVYEVAKKEHQWHWVNNFLLFGFFISVIVAILLQFRLFFCSQKCFAFFFFRIYLGYILVTEGESQTIFAMISFLSDYLEILFQRKTISISLASLCNLILVTVLPCYEKYGNWINLQKNISFFFLTFPFSSSLPFELGSWRRRWWILRCLPHSACRVHRSPLFSVVPLLLTVLGSTIPMTQLHFHDSTNS